MSSTSNVTSFGRFLRSLREARGFTNVNEYLRQYPLPISHVHYRHLETGKRKISVESAKEICQALQADDKMFYYHLLQDWLPTNVTDLFTSLVADQGQSIAPVARDAQNASAQGLAGSADAQALQPSKACCDYLNNNFSLMPILWCIYAVPSIHKKELQEVARRNNILLPIEKTLSDFRQYGLIEYADTDKGNPIVKRMAPALNFSHHELDSKILLHETEQAVSRHRQSESGHQNDTLLYYSIVSLSDTARKNIMNSIADVVASIRHSPEKSTSAQHEPFFYSLIFAARPQYDIKTGD